MAKWRITRYSCSSRNDVPAPVEVTTLWDWEAELERNELPPPPGSILTAEATGPATFRLGPAVNTDNGMPFGLGGPDTLPSGSWHIDTEILEMNLTGTLSEPSGGDDARRRKSRLITT